MDCTNENEAELSAKAVFKGIAYPLVLKACPKDSPSKRS